MSNFIHILNLDTKEYFFAAKDLLYYNPVHDDKKFINQLSWLLANEWKGSKIGAYDESELPKDFYTDSWTNIEDYGDLHDRE